MFLKPFYSCLLIIFFYAEMQLMHWNGGTTQVVAGCLNFPQSSVKLLGRRERRWKRYCWYSRKGTISQGTAGPVRRQNSHNPLSAFRTQGQTTGCCQPSPSWQSHPSPSPSTPSLPPQGQGYSITHGPPISPSPGPSAPPPLSPEPLR